jgi:hypothetical protein
MSLNTTRKKKPITGLELPYVFPYFIYLFNNNLFNDTTNSSDYTELNDEISK